MATIAELENGLRKAHAAGNADHARAFADEIRRLRSQQAAQPELPVNPTDGMSRFDLFATGMGRSMVDSYRGLKQAGTSAIRHLADNPSGTADNAVTRWADESLARQQSEIDEARRLDAPLMDTGWGLAGNAVGYMSQLLVPGAAAARAGQQGSRLAGLASRSLLPTTVAGNAAQGAALGAAQPVATGENRLANLAIGGGFGAAGAALPIAGNRLVGLFRGADYLPAGVDRRAGEVLRSQATNVNALANPAPSTVPGVQRTLGEESLDPGIMALENTMRAGQRGTFDPLDIANNVARVRALQGIAGTDADMAAAEAARGTTARAARTQAMQAGPVSLPNTMATLDAAIAAQQGRPAIQGALRQVQGLLRQADGTPESRIEVLDNVRMTIGDMLSGKYGGESAQALRGARELIDIRDALNAEIGGQVPSFTAYLDAYRQASRPISRMQVGREVLDRGSAPVPDDLGLPRLTPGAFSRVSGDLDQVAARATGFGKASASDILSPDDIQLIRSIQDDMQRQFRRQSSATVGSQTFERGEIERRTARQLASRIPVVGGFLEVFEQAATNRVKERLAYLLANPAEARRVVAALPPADRAAVNQALLQLSGAASKAAADASSDTQPLEIDVAGGRPVSRAQMEVELQAMGL